MSKRNNFLVPLMLAKDEHEYLAYNPPSEVDPVITGDLPYLLERKISKNLNEQMLVIVPVDAFMQRIRVYDWSQDRYMIIKHDYV